MKVKKTGFTALLSLFVLTAIAQKSNLIKADEKYDKYAYIDAVAVYEKVAEKGYKDEKMFQRLGNAYYFNGELTKAAKWYDQLFAMNAEQEPEYFYRYAQCLKADGNYEKADKILEEFNKKVSTDKRGILFESNKNYLEVIKANSNRFEIADAGINSVLSDYGSTILNDKLVFASARDTGGVSKKTFKWTNKSFTNLYSAVLMPDGSVGAPERFQKNINSKFNESTPVFTRDGKTMYFTRNNFLDGKRQSDTKKVTLLKLYKAILVDEKWQNITELPFNSDEFSVAHPALSPDEKTLYFASDMPGAFGQSDLFKVSINEDGTFGKPENLGSEINTEGRETFPYISGDNELFFASDGRPGLGGLDVFVSKINSDLNFEEVQNVGEPINTKQDDFAFIINSETRNGFFSSNRENGHGLDDIYRFKEIKKLICKQELTGIVSDLGTGEILAGSKIVLLDEQFKSIAEVLSDSKGSYIFSDVNCGKKYYVRASKVDYETKEIPITVNKLSGKTTLPVQLEKRIKPIEVGTDLAKVLEIPIIYFDLDKATIKKESAFQLEKIVEILNQYPDLKLDIRSHTDSRQTAQYNQILSDKRAKSTIKWLIENGIASNRLTGKGYGETQLVNQCSDDIKCSEEEHQLNRRSEFIIISM
ncbi:OmpA family protein [Flavobacterium piscis]|uniref:Outer membrane protein OmpA-like peptidoglycan-associated protein/tetratricopeptide (TPR) repeat protein n=1 Tax=Flavobacterium piscis TaxID=1114874 RepID=A0ABU1Y4K3_9FLAO|nr:OmpA family protein [Flavobacterium piscis]MDR7209167.1 outer membrane protein OmpA-like peptidoglycan-associated protein/tetratricopeptide (TPR) repeat protein [Flavobacterium piscis]